MAPDGTGDAARDGVRTDGGRAGSAAEGTSEASGEGASGATTLSRVGALASLLLVLVVVAPAVLVDGAGSTLSAFYTAGPFGLTAVGFLAVVGIVVFLSVTQGHTDTALVTGIALVVSLAAAALALLWMVTLDDTVLFGFPAEYSWLESYRWVVVAVAGAVAAVGTLLANRVL